MLHMIEILPILKLLVLSMKLPTTNHGVLEISSCMLLNVLNSVTDVMVHHHQIAKFVLTIGDFKMENASH